METFASNITVIELDSIYVKESAKSKTPFDSMKYHNLTPEGKRLFDQSSIVILIDHQKGRELMMKSIQYTIPTQEEIEYQISLSNPINYEVE